jgi:hypothetical protein
MNWPCAAFVATLFESFRKELSSSFFKDICGVSGFLHSAMHVVFDDLAIVDAPCKAKNSLAAVPA